MMEWNEIIVNDMREEIHPACEKLTKIVMEAFPQDSNTE